MILWSLVKNLMHLLTLQIYTAEAMETSIVDVK